jgi:hypothetical protein
MDSCHQQSHHDGQNVGCASFAHDCSSDGSSMMEGFATKDVQGARTLLSSAER